ncbi:similar to Saccharomyces cerevisiae YAL039C CYC3 Cytochrome c heme lyase (holocytochrome c synthase) [Maudiozyma saulgeensis]|uniref:Holocytochrome c-type synthase n=1 Tax=Maudiozyma saulgeensis TaxID=1789683 RepID=A0A1X7R7B2_9SACH|nr:similar to Saccharomyces cerevisiae YAL039C CYC3 Cytochrome c heme lyase (holocytochrome c synthase) [Kazachstania saulgeensis]
MGWFWSDTPSKGTENQIVKPNNMYDGDISLCPVMNPNGGEGSKNDLNVMNPLNFIPKDVSATEKHPDQEMHLTTERTISTIPKGNENSKWEYPSAQQMYNAMVRKGKIDSTDKDEVDENAIESMVEVHNFLNESCWYEVLDWEKQYTNETNVQPKLLRFMGKPGVLSPRARLHYYMSYIFPSHFARELPFDRHDWVILRGDPNSNDSEYPGYRRVRYVLDFYGGPDDPNGFPTFSVDVRPALDNIGNAKDRFEHLTNNITKKYFTEKSTSSDVEKK